MSKRLEECTIDELLAEVRRRFEMKQPTKEMTEEQKTAKKSVGIMLSIKEASEQTGLSYNAIRHMCLNNEVYNIRVGTKFLVNKDALMKYLCGGEYNE